MTHSTKLALAAAALVVALAGVGSWILIGRDDAPRSGLTSGAVVAATLPDEAEPQQEPAAAPRLESERVVEPSTPAPAQERLPRTLRGCVLDAAGQPVAGAKVYCGHEGTRGFENRASFLSDALCGTPEESYPKWPSWTSGANGTFEIDGLDPFLAWSVGAIHPQHGCGFASAIALGEQGADVDVRLEGGTVLSIALRQPDGAPACDRSIFVDFRGADDQPRDRNERDSFTARVRTDEHGKVQIVPVLFQSFAIQVFPGGGMRAIKPQWTTIPADAREWHVELQLERSLGLEGRGRIVSLDGTPARLTETLSPFLTDAEKARPSKETICVLAFTEDPTSRPDLVRNAALAHPRLSFGSSAPRFQYGSLDLERDEYEVALSTSELRHVAVVARGVVLGTAEVTADGSAPDIPIDVGSLPERSLLRDVRFRAVDALTGRMIDSAQVDAILFELESSGRVCFHHLVLSPDDPPPLQSFAAPVGDAMWQIYAHGYAYEHPSMSIGADSADGEPLEVVAPMVPLGGSLMGTVLRADGTPARGVKLRLYVVDGARPVWRGGAEFPGRTDSQGRFRLEEIGATQHFLVALPEDGAPVAVRVDAAASPPSPLEIRLMDQDVTCKVELRALGSDPCFASLRVLDANGCPVVDDLYPFLRQYRPMGPSSLVLTPGCYSVEARSPGRPVAQAEFDASADAIVSLTLEPPAREGG